MRMPSISMMLVELIDRLSMSLHRTKASHHHEFKKTRQYSRPCDKFAHRRRAVTIEKCLFFRPDGMRQITEYKP